MDLTLTPAQPTDGRVLDDVLRVGGAAQHAIGDAEQERAPLLECGGVGLESQATASAPTARIGYLAVVREPLAAKTEPRIEAGPEVLQGDPGGELDELRVTEVGPDAGGQLSGDLGRAARRHLGVLEDHPLAVVEEIAGAPVADCPHLGRVDALVHALVVAVVDAPGAPDPGAGGLQGKPAQRRIELLPAELGRRFQGAHGDEDAGMVRGRRGGLDHLAEAVLRVAGGQTGHEAPGVIVQRDVSHDSTFLSSLHSLSHHTRRDRGSMRDIAVWWGVLGPRRPGGCAVVPPSASKVCPGHPRGGLVGQGQCRDGAVVG